MPLRLLSLLLVVNFSTLLTGVALAAEPASTELRGPRSTDAARMPSQLGPLRATDTLWRIAERIKPAGANVSTYQVMYAIYLKNPDAFNDDNLNHLRPGATLQLPDLREIRAIDTSVARAKSDADDQAWTKRTKAVSQTSNQPGSKAQRETNAVSPEQLQQLTELKDQFGNSLLMIEAIARENNQLKSTLRQVQTELLALQQQLGDDSSLQQQLNTLLQQQADILAAQQAQELQAADAARALAVEQAQGPGIFSNPLVWVLAASVPALLILSGVVLWLKRRGQRTEAAVVAANSAAVPPADYKSPLPPLDDNNDVDDSGLFDIDESLLDDAFADHGDFTDTAVLDDNLPDFGNDTLLGDDILLENDSVLTSKGLDAPPAEDDLLNDVLAEAELADEPVKTDFDANNILSDSDLNALLATEDDDDALTELDDNELLPEGSIQQQNPDRVGELAAEDDLLEEIELDIPDEPIPSESDTASESRTTEQFPSEQFTSEPFSNEQGDDDLTDTQIASLVDDESFDRTELDAFAEALALEGSEPNTESAKAEDDAASELLRAKLADIADIAVDSEGPDLQSNDDDSVTKPSEAALSVENPSKMLDSYPELELSSDDVSDDHVELDDQAVSVELSPAAPDVDQSLAKLDDSQFDNLLTELEAMAQTTASDSIDVRLDVDGVFNPMLDDDDMVALSDADFVEIDKLLASSDHLPDDDGRFELLNVDVGLDEFADVIGNDNPQDVDTEDNGFAAKLDLVRAYIEIDDEDSAGQIIAEILDSDAPEHVKTEAETLKKSAN